MKLLNLCFVGAVLSASIMAQTSTVKVADLGWLAGCWELKNETRGLQITEMWMKPAGDSIVGASRTMRNGKMVDYEFLRIVADPSGMAYISRPSANKEDTSFKLVRSSVGELVFENPTHDFPQRIIYKLNGDKLNARIEGTRDGKTRGSDFPYARTTCK